MTFEERQQFLRLVVESVTVAEGRIKVEAVMPPAPDVELCNVRGEPFGRSDFVETLDGIEVQDRPVEP